jgi:AcrR family transcriptional regulator
MPFALAARAPQQRGLETRQRLVEAALAVFARRGYNGASTREIARHAGVALAALPYHFKTKDALWRAAADHIFRQLGQRFAARDLVLETTDLATRLRLLIREFVHFCAHHPELHHFMLREGGDTGPRLTWLVDTHIRPMVEAVRPLFEAAQAAGLLRPGRASHLHYMLIGAAAMPYAVAAEFALATGDDPCDDALVEAHIETLVDFFLVTPEGGTPCPSPPARSRSRAPKR